MNIDDLFGHYNQVYISIHYLLIYFNHGKKDISRPINGRNCCLCVIDRNLMNIDDLYGHSNRKFKCKWVKTHILVNLGSLLFEIQLTNHFYQLCNNFIVKYQYTFNVFQ